MTHTVFTAGIPYLGFQGNAAQFVYVYVRRMRLDCVYSALIRNSLLQHLPGGWSFKAMLPTGYKLCVFGINRQIKAASLGAMMRVSQLKRHTQG